MPKNITKLIIIILIVIMVLVGVLGTALFLTTDLLKSNDSLFKKYISQNVAAITDILDFSNEEEYIKTVRQSDYLRTSTGTLKYLENQNDEEETYSIKEASVVKREEKKSYRRAMVTYDNEVLTTIETLKENNILGLRLSNLVNQFISVKNANLSYFVSSIGYNGEYFSETVKSVDYSDLFKLSSQEIQSLQDTYMNAIFSGIGKNAYSSPKDSIITLSNNQSVSAKSYTLTLTKNDLDKVYKRVLTQLANDQIILQKIEQFEARMKEAGISTGDSKSLKERYSSYYTEEANKIEYNGEDARKTTITVYQMKGKTIRTDIKSDDVQISIEIPVTEVEGNILEENNDGSTNSGYTRNVNIAIEKATDVGTETETYALGKQILNGELTRTISYSGPKRIIDFSIGMKMQENIINADIKINYSSNEVSRMNFELNSKIDTESSQEIPVEFNDENNIILNDYEGEQVVSIFNNLENRLAGSIRESQARLNIKLLNKVIDFIDEREERARQKALTEQDEKNKEFNNQFELYKGTDLEYEHMQRLLDAISKNMKDYKIVDGNKIEVLIEEGTENEQKANEVKSAIIERYTYNVDINYDENGKIQSIDIYLYDDGRN